MLFPCTAALGRGTLYPPLIFAIAIKPLTALILQNPDIKGCMINTLEENTFLYVDDKLLYLSDSAGSLSTALQVISHFGNFSGFQVNWNISNIMPFSQIVSPTLPPTIPLQVLSLFEYLGIEVQLPLQNYIANNSETKGLPGNLEVKLTQKN